MKRLLLTFTTLLVFAFAFSNMAMATGHWAEKIFTTTDGKAANNGFSQLRYADGTVLDFEQGKYVKTTKQTYNRTAYGANYYLHDFHDTIQGDLYMSTAAKYSDPADRILSSNTYYHTGYFKQTNLKDLADPDKALVGGTMVLDFNLKNDKKGTVENKIANIDFYTWENPANGAMWLVFTQVAWDLGMITDAEGNEYHLYLELKSQPTNEEGAYTQLRGQIYDDVLAGTGLAAGTNLFAWATDPADWQWFAFKLGAYGANVDPYATPVPAAVWLMGTGVAGLMALRRRNS